MPREGTSDTTRILHHLSSLTLRYHHIQPWWPQWELKTSTSYVQNIRVPVTQQRGMSSYLRVGYGNTEEGIREWGLKKCQNLLWFALGYFCAFSFIVSPWLRAITMMLEHTSHTGLPNASKHLQAHATTFNLQHPSHPPKLVHPLARIFASTFPRRAVPECRPSLLRISRAAWHWGKYRV